LFSHIRFVPLRICRTGGRAARLRSIPRHPGSLVMSKPSIVINKTDHDRLTTLANGLLDRKPEMAEGLLNELERARVVEKGASLQGTVQMGATVEYTTNDGHDRIVTLVYPAEADISQGKVSI